MATAPLIVQNAGFADVIPPALLTHFVQTGVLSSSDAASARAVATKRGLHIAEVLISRYGFDARMIAQSYATLYQAQYVHPCDNMPDGALIDDYGAAQAIRAGILPWRRIGGRTVVLTDKPDQFERHLPQLTRIFGPLRMAVTTRSELEKAVLMMRQAALGRAAETKVADHLSCRSWKTGRACAIFSAISIVLLGLAVVAPVTIVAVLCAVAVTVLVLGTALKAVAAVTFLRKVPTDETPCAVPARLPKITLLVPLFRETEIAQHLLARLSELDYPRELMDVCLVTESCDQTTRDAVSQTVLPPWMRPIVVPKGTLQTKPRALNFALDFAQGSIIGVYDAEDAPAPDQLHKVAAHFANCSPKVACLQGVLDYYNDNSNWLTRCFTIEYASWFRVVLPGLEHLGLVVPLGGTTLFFRRDVLEDLGGWDAHNVTEDADLGVRLARAGYRTELIATVTQEEANGRFWPWIKQRSRWLKGYAITYAVHMRAPRKLWADLGPKRFWGVQLLFAGTLSQFILAPVLWSFWVLPFGIYHPLEAVLAPMVFWALAAVFFTSEIVNLWVASIALRAANKTWLIKWALTLQLYFPLAAVAAYKGILELAWRPYYWDKTSHGVLLTGPSRGLPPRLARRSSDG